MSKLRLHPTKTARSSAQAFRIWLQSQLTAQRNAILSMFGASSSGAPQTLAQNPRSLRVLHEISGEWLQLDSVFLRLCQRAKGLFFLDSRVWDRGPDYHNLEPHEMEDLGLTRFFKPSPDIMETSRTTLLRRIFPSRAHLIASDHAGPIQGLLEAVVTENLSLQDCIFESSVLEALARLSRPEHLPLFLPRLPPEKLDDLDPTVFFPFFMDQDQRFVWLCVQVTQHSLEAETRSPTSSLKFLENLLTDEGLISEGKNPKTAVLDRVMQTSCLGRWDCSVCTFSVDDSGCQELKFECSMCGTPRFNIPALPTQLRVEWEKFLEALSNSGGGGEGPEDDDRGWPTPVEWMRLSLWGLEDLQHRDEEETASFGGSGLGKRSASEGSFPTSPRSTKSRRAAASDFHNSSNDNNGNDSSAASSTHTASVSQTGLRSFIRRFSPAWTWARALHSAVQVLEKRFCGGLRKKPHPSLYPELDRLGVTGTGSKLTPERLKSRLRQASKLFRARAVVLLLQLLSLPHLPHLRGNWWVRLSVNLKHLKRPELALACCEAAYLKDPYLKTGTRMDIELRGHRLWTRHSRGDKSRRALSRTPSHSSSASPSSEVIVLDEDPGPNSDPGHLCPFPHRDSQLNGPADPGPLLERLVAEVGDWDDSVISSGPDGIGWRYTIGRALTGGEPGLRSRFLSLGPDDSLDGLGTQEREIEVIGLRDLEEEEEKEEEGLERKEDELCNVEELALELYARPKNGGWEGIHCENRLFGTLFGLLMWDCIFDCETAGHAWVHPYQDAPLDWGSEAFFLTRHDRIQRYVCISS